MDLQTSPDYAALDVPLVSIAFDSAAEQMNLISQYGISGVPMLVDAYGAVSEAYGVLRYAVGTGEPGHTFVLVGADGDIAWYRDYGAAENGGTMYVDPAEITREVATALGG